MQPRNLVAICIVAASAIAIASASATSTDLAAKVLEGLNPTAMAKLAVSEKFIQNGIWPDSNESAGFTAPSSTSSGVAVGPNGTITVTYQTPETISGGSIVLTPSSSEGGVIHWHCSSDGIPADALPLSCRDA